MAAVTAAFNLVAFWRREVRGGVPAPSPQYHPLPAGGLCGRYK